MNRLIVLFWVQVALMLVGCISQGYHMARVGIGGVNVAMFLGTEVSFIINLILAIKAYSVLKDTATKHTVIIYFMWVLFWGIDSCIAVREMHKDPTTFDNTEIGTLIVMSLGIIMSLAYMSVKKIGISDPRTKVGIAISLRSLPHFCSSLKTIVAGGAGWSPAFMVQGHLSLILRLYLNHESVRAHGLDQNRRCNLFVEWTNWIAFMALTLSWLLWLWK